MYVCKYKCLHIKNKKLFDFDACSLYLSAMRRMLTIEGTIEYMEFDGDIWYDCNNMPDILIHAMDKDQTEPIEDKYYSQFFITIKIEDIGIHRKFPLICKSTESGMNYVNECVMMNVDMITLQDLIKYQNIMYRILEGYACRGRRDHKIRTFIKELYDKRVEFKKEGNPVQLAIKLLMSSMYGKTIQKPLTTTNKKNQ